MGLNLDVFVTVKSHKITGGLSNVDETVHSEKGAKIIKSENSGFDILRSLEPQNLY